jgi:hypothetical protein
VEVSDDLDDLLDHSEEDEELIEISRYQILNQLQQNSRSKRAAIKDDNNKMLLRF